MIIGRTMRACPEDRLPSKRAHASPVAWSHAWQNDFAPQVNAQVRTFGSRGRRKLGQDGPRHLPLGQYDLPRRRLDRRGERHGLGADVT